MPKVKKWYLQIMFKTKDPSPPSMTKFYKSLPKSIETKWLYQEYAVGGAFRGQRHIGYVDLTGEQVSSVITQARKFFPKVKFKQEVEP